jgi:hypothetical protein
MTSSAALSQPEKMVYKGLKTRFNKINTYNRYAYMLLILGVDVVSGILEAKAIQPLSLSFGRLAPRDIPQLCAERLKRSS